MTRSPFSCVLWDIDGTVVDASEGILRRLTITLAHFGHPAPTHDELIHWIGPPMHESFQTNLGMTPEKATEAVSFYRVLGKADGYTTGARLYPGVADLMVELDEAGVPQSTASSKPEIQVRALMEHFGLAPRLREIVGATSDEKTLSSKSDIVAEALRRLTADGVDVSRPVLIGDRHHDVEGGAANDVPVIFVSWGFSTPDEADGAIAVAADIDDLRAQLLPAE
ncbi:HAD hydrolase-like protein [Microbacterium sp. AG238]|uniref:HAD hydrolase-like protein n=1 Tax=Microbacterium sp. AG238 TaxID=2183994 RepID=UPI000E741F54|nr:HAD hydrolase-like protein [Microbacterium sp. AG238]RKE64638.1 phosphoglycolate phosphatase [Microbacterium sp. AG238]